MAEKRLNKPGKASAKPAGTHGPSAIAIENIRTVSELEQTLLDQRTLGECIGDAISRRAGKIGFAMFHVVWFGTWIILNAGWIKAIPAFDPYPYGFLTLVVSLEAIFLSLFILMSQNRAARQADQRAQLDLQINLLAETESTRILEMLKALCDYHGLSIGHETEIEELAQPTEPKALVTELQERLPGSS
jgi:uncharacterized membrane protein